MQRQRSEGDEKRPRAIPGDAQHEITVAFRENPGAHGDRFGFVTGSAPCGEFNSASSAFFASLTRLGALRSPSRLPGTYFRDRRLPRPIRLYGEAPKSPAPGVRPLKPRVHSIVPKADKDRKSVV